MRLACLCVVIDGKNAYVAGTLEEGTVVHVQHYESLLRGRHRRGGQSAARFQRSRQGAENTYLKRVVENILSSGYTYTELVIGGSRHLRNSLAFQLGHANTMLLPMNGCASRASLDTIIRLWKDTRSTKICASVTALKKCRNNRNRVDLKYLLELWTGKLLLSIGTCSLQPLIQNGIDTMYIVGSARIGFLMGHRFPGYHVVANSLGWHCEVCRKPSMHVCACRRIRYCSRRCQKRHWLYHRRVCSASNRRRENTLMTTLCLRSTFSQGHLDEPLNYSHALGIAV